MSETEAGVKATVIGIERAPTIQDFGFRYIRNQRPLPTKEDGDTWEVMCGPRRIALCTHENDAEHIVECLKEHAERETVDCPPSRA